MVEAAVFLIMFFDNVPFFIMFNFYFAFQKNSIAIVNRNCKRASPIGIRWEREKERDVL